MSSTDKTKLDGIATNANNYVHPTSGIVTGTYTKITVDSNGHVTAGSTPTTLAGYSIGDAYTKAEVVSEINKIEEW
jgi:phage-related tail fiber protein